ncbi:threonylcarbamoyl-AMP synthase [Candidatus Beckwithbacteria bacterium CG10_big_fil_rev_8_21_14_0_10_34_10]|uniref:L-threonylcarbamoyladenylate synthase n=1 Tax=Candidatus Beckwithbacteria bacterium CG10_big_fil_rev_8_21_14_0_10_34_10 TaxID=1974495 RepID=A0A2H0WB64_9BACT|nr:MAG: threonylcarbamoyl-AMP synthase [Candidatus Beckwithbacteria bacterium CG10_big_fil_rev_8_21_14_0_10_34_10]
MKIKKETIILEILDNYPQLESILVEKYGLHCLGCMGAAFETLEQGAMAHGMKKKEMEMMIKDLNKRINDENKFDQTIKVLKKGGIIIFPTDTVWGVGCLVNNLKATKKLYQIKKRETSKPTAVLVGTLKQAQKLAYLNPKSKELIKKHWPGGLTIILKAKKIVPKIIQGPNKTIGLRMPDHSLILKIIKRLDYGLVAGSANLAGKKAPTRKADINLELIKKIDFLLEGKNKGNQASTVVDLTQEPFKVLRQGWVKIS